MSHNNVHRLPGFAHFESSLNNPMCSFEQLDIRFATEEVGLPPPYPGTNNGLDLSSVNGLDLTSPNYEGLNLTQQCLNLSNSNRINGSQVSQGPVQVKTSNLGLNEGPHQQQIQQFPCQSEMVLNLSTQIGLNLTRQGQTGMAFHNPMMAQDMNVLGGAGTGPTNFNAVVPTVPANNPSFDYYGNYYDSGYHSSTTAAATALGHMEEQRSSPLNLEHRSSPLNLTSVGNVQRKRKPTPGQSLPLNMGKISSMVNQQQNVYQQQSIPQQSRRQDFTFNNQVFDCRVPNKISSFYNQQQQGLAGPTGVDSQQIRNIQNPSSAITQNCATNMNDNQQRQGKTTINGKNMNMVIDQSKKQQYQSFKQNNPTAETSANNIFYQNMQLPQSVSHAIGISNELFFEDLDFNGNGSLAEVNVQSFNITNQPQPSNITAVNKPLGSSGKSYPTFKTAETKVSKGKPASQTIKIKCKNEPKKESSTEIKHSSTESNNSVVTQNSTIQHNNFPCSENYTDLGFAYTDALNYAAEAMNVHITPLDQTATDPFKNIKPGPSNGGKEGVFPSQAKYACDICALRFQEESQLLSHNKLIHEGAKTKQISEQVSKGNADKLIGVNPDKSEEKSRQKNTIRYEPKHLSSNDIQRLKDEMAKEPFPYQCITCAKKFAQKDDLVQHLDDHNEMKPFKCGICNLGFTYISAKRRHEKTHTQEKPFKCKDCSKSFFRKSEITQHQKTHNKVKIRHPCESCGQMFNTSTQLENHKCSANQPLSKQIKCEICTSVLATKVEWGVHMWKHTKDSSYIIISESDPLPKFSLNKKICKQTNSEGNDEKKNSKLNTIQ